MSKTPCFYIPKQLLTPEYARFSAESRMLFSMIFTNAEHTKSILETAELIQSIGKNELYNMRHEFEESIKESEGK